jgi:hypothetical protein
MSMKYLAAAAVILAASGMSVHADTGSSKSSTVFRIHGYVPVLCRVELATSVSVPDEDGVAQLGVAREFCNAAQGYTVYVNHPADLEGAAVISEGVRIPLSPTGETVLTESSHADIRLVQLAVDVGDEPEKFRHIGVRIEAHG